MSIAKEIRIGNFMEFNGSFSKATPYTIKGLSTGISVAKPIPLTEEWLVKFGFEKRTENAGILICYKISRYTIARWTENRWQFWIGTVDLYKSPQFVHELQNLYFCLTGQELEVSE